MGCSRRSLHVSLHTDRRLSNLPGRGGSGTGIVMENEFRIELATTDDATRRRYYESPKKM